MQYFHVQVLFSEPVVNCLCNTPLHLSKLKYIYNLTFGSSIIQYHIFYLLLQFSKHLYYIKSDNVELCRSYLLYNIILTKLDFSLVLTYNWSVVI